TFDPAYSSRSASSCAGYSVTPRSATQAVNASRRASASAPRGRTSARVSTRRSGAAEGAMRRRARRCRLRVLVEALALVERVAEDVDQRLEGSDVAVRGGGERLLHLVVARDVDRVLAIHRIGDGRGLSVVGRDGRVPT